MNTYTFKKSISFLVKLLFVALAVGALSLTAQAGSLDGQQLQQDTGVLQLNTADGQGEALQSQLPTCGVEVDGVADSVAGISGTAHPTPTFDLCQTCCFGGYPCCSDCKAAGLVEDDTDAS